MGVKNVPRVDIILKLELDRCIQFMQIMRIHPKLIVKNVKKGSTLMRLAQLPFLIVQHVSLERMATMTVYQELINAKNVVLELI